MYSGITSVSDIIDVGRDCRHTICPAIDIRFMTGDPRIIEKFSPFNTHT